MKNYWDIYLKRLNRYGENYQSRIQTKRQKVFEDKLLKSIYRVDFSYNDQIHPGTLEKYKQDETETLSYLLTRVDLLIPEGTIIETININEVPQKWMIFWLENMQASGYNRYVVLKMTHELTWQHENSEFHSLAYMWGPQSSAITNTIQSTSKSSALYIENQNSNFFIMPLNKDLNRDDYIEININNIKEAYKVTGYDRQSSKGVEYVTVDPVYIRDNSSLPETDNTDNSYWLNGGNY